MENNRPILIVKKKAGHGGHHGGAWKVAYADFVTAMMALFIVLWLLNTSKPVKEAIAGYFKDPSGTSRKAGTALVGAGENFTLTKDNMPKLKDELEKAMRQMSDFDKLKNHIDMTVTAEGLRIEMMESATGTFFNSGSARLNDAGKELLITLAGELGKLPNKISIEGHTDSNPYAGSANYGNWELSSDRANAAPPPDAGQRHPCRPGYPGPRLRRSAAARAHEPPRPLQPPHLGHRAIHREKQRGRGGQTLQPRRRRGEDRREIFIRAAARFEVGSKNFLLL
jgi:chemotaxis protein MotB